MRQADARVSIAVLAVGAQLPADRATAKAAIRADAAEKGAAAAAS